MAPPQVIAELIARGQVGTQYVGCDGKPTMDVLANPNGSLEAIEGIFSPDGRVFGVAEERADKLGGTLGLVAAGEAAGQDHNLRLPNGLLQGERSDHLLGQAFPGGPQAQGSPPQGGYPRLPRHVRVG